MRTGEWRGEDGFDPVLHLETPTNLSSCPLRVIRSSGTGSHLHTRVQVQVPRRRHGVPHSSGVVRLDPDRHVYLATPGPDTRRRRSGRTSTVRHRDPTPLPVGGLTKPSGRDEVTTTSAFSVIHGRRSHVKTLKWTSLFPFYHLYLDPRPHEDWGGSLRPRTPILPPLPSIPTPSSVPVLPFPESCRLVVKPLCLYNRWTVGVRRGTT